MRVLRDGDRVDVLARSIQDADGNVFIEPWGPEVLPAHRVAEHGVGPFSVPVDGWPPGPVIVDEAVVVNDIVPGQVWRISGTWRSGTVEFGSRTLTEHPRAKHFHASPSPTAGRKVKWTSPLDSAQQAALDQKRAEGLVVTSYPSKNPDGEVVYSIFTSDPSAVRDALDLRPDQRVSVEPSPWTAATVEGTRAAISGHLEDWHVFASGQRKGTTSLPLVFTTSVAWLEPELLELYHATPSGLLELDVWLSPAAGQ
jgi:hypothetical protein